MSRGVDLPGCLAVACLLLGASLACSASMPEPNKCQGQTYDEAVGLPFARDIGLLIASGACDEHQELRDCPEAGPIYRARDERADRWAACR